MPTFAVIATIADTSTDALHSLTLGGLEIEPLVDRNTIRVTEEGPGGVSSMTFTLWDGSLAVDLEEMDRVAWYDLVNDRPLFAGFVQSWKKRPSATGRYIDVRCIGGEAALDWMVIPVAVTFAAAEDAATAIQSLYYLAAGVGVELRVFKSAKTTDEEYGNQERPVGSYGVRATAGILDSAVSIAAGTSLREAIVRLVGVTRAADPGGGSGDPRVVPGFVTVDPWWGLRVWGERLPGAMPHDYASMTVEDTIAGAVKATVLDAETDAGSAVRQVFVIGGNAASTGIVSDASGIPGPIDRITDTTITTADERDALGRAYLADKRSGVRGSVEVENASATSNVRPGAFVTITDVQAGLAGDTFRIASITKTFRNGRPTWQVAFGGLRPSAMRLTRRLTRFRS
jgi:hypothetical protein